MYHTIQLSSCVYVQGEYVSSLANGEIVISDGHRKWRGLPINRVGQDMPCARKSAKFPEQPA